MTTASPFALLAALVCAFPGCARLTTVAPACGTGVNQGVCTDTMTRIPAHREADFLAAGRAAIDIVHSDTLVAELRAYMRRHPETASDRAWAGLTPEGIATDLRASLPGIGVGTFGGLVGWSKWTFAGNTGSDGGSGPVLVNSIPLRKRSMSQLANTLVHEAAHRAGMTHPASARSLPRAFCQPPYVVGTLVERLVEGPAWEWSPSQHCITFAGPQ